MCIVLRKPNRRVMKKRQTKKKKKKHENRPMKNECHYHIKLMVVVVVKERCAGIKEIT